MTMQGDLANMVTALRLCLGSPSSSTSMVAERLTGLLPVASTGAGMHFAQAAGLSHVRPASGNPEEMQVHLQVPDKFAGAILGRGGAEIKQTAATAACSVSLTNRSGTIGSRRAVIVGTYSQCAMAQALLHEQMAKVAEDDGGQQFDHNSTEVTVVFLIQKGAVGAVIGKAAAGLKTIREQCGVQVHIDREEVQGHRPCHITGLFQAVLQAEKRIYDLSVETVVKELTNGGGPPRVESAPTQLPFPGVNSQVYAALAAGAPAAKRQRTDDDGGTGGTTKMLILSTSAGAVIGKHGSGLKRIRESCGVKVDMSTQLSAPPQHPNDRVVCLVGPLPARQAAMAVVLGLAFPPEQTAGECELKLLVPDSTAGSIIGKQGSTLKVIREQSGVSVNVDREGSSGERLVSARGNLSEVVSVGAMVLGIVDQPSSGGGGAIPRLLA